MLIALFYDSAADIAIAEKRSGRLRKLLVENARTITHLYLEFLAEKRWKCYNYKGMQCGRGDLDGWDCK